MIGCFDLFILSPFLLYVLLIITITLRNCTNMCTYLTGPSALFSQNMAGKKIPGLIFAYWSSYIHLLYPVKGSYLIGRSCFNRISYCNQNWFLILILFFQLLRLGVHLPQSVELFWFDLAKTLCQMFLLMPPFPGAFLLAIFFQLFVENSHDVNCRPFVL